MFFYLEKNFSLFDFVSKFNCRSTYGLPKLKTAFISVSEKLQKNDIAMSIPLLFAAQGLGGSLIKFTTIRRAAASFKTRKYDLYGAVSMVHKRAVYELFYSCFTILIPELVDAGFTLTANVNSFGSLAFGLSDLKPLPVFFETEFSRLPYKVGASVSINLSTLLEHKKAKAFFSSFCHLDSNEILSN